LIRTGVTTAEAMVAKRPYIIVGAFVVGMLLTPPDVISQTLLAIPVWLLFELGVFLSRRVQPIKADEDDVDDDSLTDEEMEAELRRVEIEEEDSTSN